MSLSNPNAQLVRLKVSGQPDRHFLFITSHFDYSNYDPDGVISMSGPDSNGKLSVSIGVTTNGQALRLNKTIYHQIDLDGVNVNDIKSSEISVYESTDLLTTAVIVHQDESEVIVKPDH